MTNLISSDEISAEDYLLLFHNKEPHLFLDVRELWEVETAHIASSQHIPLRSLEYRFDELPHDRWIITYCHHGGRSLRACHLLREKGFVKVVSLKGGIQRWAEVVDQTMPTY